MLDFLTRVKLSFRMPCVCLCAIYEGARVLYCHPNSVSASACRRLIATRVNVTMECIRVTHCYDAWGCKICLRGEGEGRAILYSGDCIPSNHLIRAGRRCTLVIHEATYASEKTRMARERKHSTISQAIAVAEKMEARSAILTHFSQRYPKAIDIQQRQDIDIGGTTNTNAQSSIGAAASHATNGIPTGGYVHIPRLPVCTAFDGIDIDFGMLPHLRLLNDHVKCELDRLERIADAKRAHEHDAHP